MSLVVLNSCFYLGGDYVKTVTLPDDLMVMPVQTDIENIGVNADKTRVHHSDKTGQWYITISIDNPVPGYPEIREYLFASGSWVEIARYLCLWHEKAPFKFGVPLENNRCSRIKYIPVWESVVIGEGYNEEDDWTYNISEDHYKLIHCAAWMSPDDWIEEDTTMRYNSTTSFEVVDYGNDLIKLTKDIELYTGMKF